MKNILLLGNGELVKTVERIITDFINRDPYNPPLETLAVKNNDFDVNKETVITDLLISAGYNKRIVLPLKNKVFCINVHLSPLPRYAGFNPLYWAIKNDEKEWGITLHKIEEEFDTGPIISQITFPVSTGDTARSLYDKSLEKVSLLFSCLERLLYFQGNITTKPQDLTKRTFFKKKDVDFSLPITFDGTEESYRELRARFFPEKMSYKKE
jgi:methionyl-tRNA formyltransferase